MGLAALPGLAGEDARERAARGREDRRAIDDLRRPVAVHVGDREAAAPAERLCAVTGHRLVARPRHVARPVDDHDLALTRDRGHVHVEVAVEVAERDRQAREAERVVARAAQRPHLAAGRAVEDAQDPRQAGARQDAAARAAAPLGVARDEDDVGRVELVDRAVAVGVHEAADGRGGPHVGELGLGLGDRSPAPLRDGAQILDGRVVLAARQAVPVRIILALRADGRQVEAAAVGRLVVQAQVPLGRVLEVTGRFGHERRLAVASLATVA